MEGKAMAIDVGEPMGPVATPGSVLFVGSGPALAQDNAGFYFDQADNTARTANAVVKIGDRSINKMDLSPFLHRVKNTGFFTYNGTINISFEVRN
jgi:hypothetical protein